jgi:hypothetical protein
MPVIYLPDLNLYLPTGVTRRPRPRANRLPKQSRLHVIDSHGKRRGRFRLPVAESVVPVSLQCETDF